MLPLKLDLDCKINNHDYLTIMQGYTYKVEVNLFDNDESLDLTNATINIDFMKADKKFIIKTKDIVKSGNKVTFDTDADFTNISGKAKMQIIVKDGTHVFGSWVVDIIIKESAINDNDGQSENKLTITQDLKETIAEAERMIVEVPLQAQEKIEELTEQSKQAISTLTEQSKQSITEVSQKANTEIDGLITKAEDIKTKLDESIANGDVEAIKNEVFNDEYGTFITGKATSKVGESTTSPLMTLEEPMEDESLNVNNDLPTTLEEPMVRVSEIVPIESGYAKDCNLKGQTLVNVLPKNKSSVDYVLTEDYAPLQFSNIGDFPLKPNTNYLFVYNLTTNGLTSGTFNVQSSSSEYAFENGTIPITSATKVGIYKHIIKTKQNFDGIKYAFRQQNLNGRGTIKIDNMMLFEYQEGMETWDIPYFEGMASVENPVVETIGKNLFDGEMELGTFDEMGLPKDSVKCVRTKNYQEVEPNTKYVFKNDMGYSLLGFGYTKEKEYIGTVTFPNNVITTPSNCYYIKFRTAEGSLQNDYSVKIQMEKGETSTDFESYKSNVVEPKTYVVLRSLPNGGCDTLDLLTGEYVQRIGYVHLDGYEAWEWLNMAMTPSNMAFAIPLPNAKNTVLNSTHVLDDLGFCKNVGSTVNYSPFDGKRSFCIHENGNVYFSIPKTELETQDVNGWKKFLNNNNIKLQYELATPIVKTIDLTAKAFFFKDGYVNLSADEGSILPTLDYTVPLNLKSQSEITAEMLAENYNELKSGKLGTNEKAVDSNRLNGKYESTTPENNSIPVRDGDGDIYTHTAIIFTDVAHGGGSRGSIGIDGSRYVPAFKDNDGAKSDIWCGKNLPIERGSWTPRVVGTTSGEMEITSRNCMYLRIGNLVHVCGEITVTGAGSAVGNANISGLPFTPNGAGTFAGVISDITNVTSTLLTHSLLGFGGNPNLRIRHRRVDSGSTGSTTVGGLTPTSGSINITFSITYNHG